MQEISRINTRYTDHCPRPRLTHHSRPVLAGKERGRSSCLPWSFWRGSSFMSGPSIGPFCLVLLGDGVWSPCLGEGVSMATLSRGGGSMVNRSRGTWSSYPEQRGEGYDHPVSGNGVWYPVWWWRGLYGQLAYVPPPPHRQLWKHHLPQYCVRIVRTYSSKEQLHANCVIIRVNNRHVSFFNNY